MSRLIVLDTETTGISPLEHKVIEIGCVEIVDRRITGKHFHSYLNPQRKIDPGAFQVHGISEDFLKDKPKFKDIVPEFLTFIAGSALVIHNAPFDLGFLNAELARIKIKQVIEHNCEIIDTLTLAREKHKGQRNSLDALIKRYNVKFNRDLHGALLDAQILARVYLAMTGGQKEIFLEQQKADNKQDELNEKLSSISPVIYPDTLEMELHEKFLREVLFLG
jgi:DNA polymerase III subunit epsilon